MEEQGLLGVNDSIQKYLPWLSFQYKGHPVDVELAFTPGEHYEYGTINYDVLGLVIETVSGQSYENFMKEQVLNPLGLHLVYLQD